MEDEINSIIKNALNFNQIKGMILPILTCFLKKDKVDMLYV